MRVCYNLDRKKPVPAGFFEERNKKSRISMIYSHLA